MIPALTATATGVVLVAMLFALLRAALGPTVYDRILAINVFGTVTILMIALFGFLVERPEFFDIALLYALINFVGTIAVLRFMEYRRPDPEAHQPEEGEP